MSAASVAACPPSSKEREALAERPPRLSLRNHRRIVPLAALRFRLRREIGLCSNPDADASTIGLFAAWRDGRTHFHR